MKIKPGKYFLQGNIALAEAAIKAGCLFYAGYPITPASEIMEHMAKRLPEEKGVFIQMEDEIASIAACIGASWAGVKAMTATSGPGFSLMQENIGLAVMTETPLVIVDVQRTGPSTGQATKAAQGDIMQTRWGRHGDQEVIVLAPNSVQEMFNLTIKAFNLTEKYRTPVIVLADEAIAHLHENLTVKEGIEVFNREKPRKKEKRFFGCEKKDCVPPMPSVGEGFDVLVTGSSHDEYGVRFTANPQVHEKLVNRLVNKIRLRRKEIIEAETYMVDECEIGVVSIGCVSRAVYEAVELAEKEGFRVGFVRPKTVWPFPEEQVEKLASNANFILVPELNTGQLIKEVERVTVTKKKEKVIPFNKIGGGRMISPTEILKEIKRLSRN